MPARVLPEEASKAESFDSPTVAQPEEAAKIPAFVRFRYIGRQSMTVVGGITGQAYRFAMPGAKVLIDPRDAPGMYAVPNVEVARRYE